MIKWEDKWLFEKSGDFVRRKVVSTQRNCVWKERCLRGEVVVMWEDIININLFD